MYSGIKLAALYGIYPHQLGFCGSREKSIRCQIYDFLLGKKVSQQKIRKILEGFKGAFFYYKLIAKSNKIKDPFDEGVVRAYWIGNNLLEKIKTEDLRKMIREDFTGPGLLSKKVVFKKAEEIPEGSNPHHSFHVLVIGSVTGRVILKGKLLDLCRVSWGRVRKMQKGKVHPVKSRKTGAAEPQFKRVKNKKLIIVVKYQPLVGKKILKLGQPIEKEIFWDKNLIPNMKIGDWVSFHWNHLVQRLNKREVKNLEKYMRITLRSL